MTLKVGILKRILEIILVVSERFETETLLFTGFSL
jgi:hypothetical protein